MALSCKRRAESASASPIEQDATLSLSGVGEDDACGKVQILRSTHNGCGASEGPYRAPRRHAYGCVQDIVFSNINRDTVDVLLAAGCEVHTPRVQYCCGSLHAHNGEVEVAKALARRQIDAFDVDELDAIITNAAGCGCILRATASSWPTIPGIPRGHAHGPRKSATFMSGFVK